MLMPVCDVFIAEHGIKDFETLIYDPNMKISKISVEIKEVLDNLYRITFYPTKIGYWIVVIKHSSFPLGKANIYFSKNYSF
jgi:fructose-1,6-bisphosphatase